MLFKFKSKTCADLIMLEEGGKLVLALIGKESGPTGIIEVTEMAVAVEKLENILRDHELGEHAAPIEQSKNNKGEKSSNGGSDKNEALDPITIKQRIIPFLEMLKRSKSNGQPIVWGV